ncbi:MAG: TIGR03032 family protein [Cytophagales bacterium]
MSQLLPPFSCTFSPNMPELMYELGINFVISTYQAGKVVILSAPDKEKLIQLPRDFKQAMGIAIEGNRMAIATNDEVIVLGHNPQLGPSYPSKPDTYDTLYVPRATFYTGSIDMHDMHFVGNNLLGVNTRFSCLTLVDFNQSFTPIWRPHFISELAPEDRCHLNGLAVVDGKPKYVTALGKADTFEGWRPTKASGGILMDVEKNEIMVEGLPMPHSPRVYDNQLYVLLSASGELAKVDLATNKFEVLCEFDGFCRGFVKYGDFLFVGMSKIRQNSSAFKDLPISKKSTFSGIVAVHMPTMTKVAHIKYENSVEEIYDVQVIPGFRRPGLLNTSNEAFKQAIVTPTDTYWTKPNDNEAVTQQ